MTDTKQIASVLARRSLYHFVRRAFSQLRPGVPFEDNWHIEAMCHALEAVASGETQRLVITMPPRHMKSTIASVAFSAYLLGHQPNRRIIAASYGQDLATKLSQETRQLMEAAWYRSLFPRSVIRTGQSTQEEFHTTENGYRKATSVGGSLTGFGGDLLLIDDPMKAEDADSPAKRRSVIDWFQNTAATRLDNRKTGAMIVIQQRLHEEDLAGVLLETGDWTHLNLPAIAEEAQTIPLNAREEWPREVGDALHPERVSPEELERIKREVGSRTFAAQYQQRPGPAGGDIVKWAWFRRHDPQLRRQAGDLIVQSWDFAFTVEETADYSVCLTFIYRNGRLYLIDVLRQRLESPHLRRFIPKHASHWNASVVILESAGISVPLVQELRQLDSRRYQYYTPRSDKITRLASFASLIEQGLVSIPTAAPWLAAFKQELEYFPNGRYKDQVDALSHLPTTPCYQG